ncbi:MAG: arylsulfatase [Planctomycetales bacterium]|nr:arylsulfatase [Planctomycetales bacterium]
MNLRQCLVGIALFAITSQLGNSAEMPNIVVILSDDQGWGDLSLNGNTNLQTPNIDGLARDGARFDRFYVCPVCSPTRAEFLTGRYHPRSGVYSTSAGGERMDLDETTIADTFRAAGYATGAFGKWHNGMQYPYHPNGRGFDEYYGFCSGHWGDYFSPPLEHNGQMVQGEGFCVDDFTDKAIRFMQLSVDSKKPFLAYLPFNIPHSPMQVPDKYWDKFKNAELTMRNREPDREDIPHTRSALAMCENIDYNVGRILEKLDQWGIAENTIVLYFCDNGPNGVRWNGGMKGRKGSTDEGGVRSPLIIRWPNGIPAGKLVMPIAGAIDLLPTLAELAKIERVGTNPLDGRSLAPLLTGQADVDWPDREIVSFWNNRVSVRNQRFRLDASGQLFDMSADPGQRDDVSQKHPNVTERLARVANQFREEILPGYDDDNRPFLLGHKNYRFTQLPARDALGTGNIKRSNRFPNCSFLTNWTSTSERINWDVEVGATGVYAVELQYTCSAEDVGAVIQLQCGSATLQATITEAHNPPLRGQEHDRTPRVESYVKDFATMSLGTIKLEQGARKLELSAIQIPGKQVMDFRLLMFTKQ